MCLAEASAAGILQQLCPHYFRHLQQAGGNSVDAEHKSRNKIFHTRISLPMQHALKARANAGAWKLALEMLQKIYEEDVAPRVISYITAMKVYEKDG